MFTRMWENLNPMHFCSGYKNDVFLAKSFVMLTHLQQRTA